MPFSSAGIVEVRKYNVGCTQLAFFIFQTYFSTVLPWSLNWSISFRHIYITCVQSTYWYGAVVLVVRVPSIWDTASLNKAEMAVLSTFTFCFTWPDVPLLCDHWSGKVQGCLSISEDEYKKTMKVNVITPWFLMKAIAKRFEDTKFGGSVVFLTQIIGAERGLYPGAAAYGTSLGAIHQLVRVSILVLLLWLVPYLCGSIDSSCPNKIK